MKKSFPLRSVFLAVPLEGEAKQAYTELQGRLAEFGAVLQFQNPETPHLTLQFWHEVMEIEYGQIIPQAEKISAATGSFTIKAEEAATFGDKGNDRVLFLGIPFDENLARLKKRFPWPSPQPFSPHVTLAWIKHPQRFTVVKKKVMKILSNASFTIHADRLRLYAEIEGQKQTVMRDFPFTTV